MALEIPEDVEIWVEFWAYTIGANVIPADTKAKKTWITWSQWQDKPIPEEQYKQWLREGAFNKGMGIILGKVWRGKHQGKYLVFIDCDNAKAIEEFCTRDGTTHSLKDNLAQKFLVEQRDNSPDRCHIFFYSQIPFVTRPSDKSNPDFDPSQQPSFEVKSSSGGMAYVTPSIHPSGQPYRIIGTMDPVTLSSLQAHQMMHHIDTICQRYGLRYLENAKKNGHSNKNGSSLIPTSELFLPETKFYEGQNRHLHHLRACESVIKRNWYGLFREDPDQIRKICDDWNNEHCIPPLPQDDIDRQWDQAIEFVEKIIAEEERERLGVGAKEKEEEKQEEQKMVGSENEISEEEVGKLTDTINEEIKKEHEQLQAEEEKKNTNKAKSRVTIPNDNNPKTPSPITDKRAVELVKQFLKYHDPNRQPITWDMIQKWRQEKDLTGGDWNTMLDTFPNVKLFQLFCDNGLRDIHYFPIVKIKELGVKFSDRLVAVTGQVIGVSELKPDPISVVHDCVNCHWLHPPRSRDDPALPPKQCVKCGQKEFTVVFRAPEGEEEMWDMQGIILQDGPLSISCTISGVEKDMWRVNPGQKAYALGILKFEVFTNTKTKKLEFRKYLKLLCIHPLTNKDIIITQYDIERFNDMTKDPMFLQFLIDSFAPFIYGLEEQKELCIYTLGSQGIDRPNNSLLAGPPARAKTELVKYTIRLSHNGGYIAFSNTSVPGLTSATEVDADTGIRINKPGKFVIHAGGIVGLTELQSIKKKDDLKTSLNQAMEDKEVATAKAEGGYNLKANCAILIDSNNYAASWDYEARLAHNLQFMEPNLQAFLSRIDLISISPKIVDRKVLREVARSNFRAYRDKTDPVESHIEDWETENHEPRYGYNTLRKYFFYVTQQVSLPPLRADLEDKFADFYEDAMENNSEYLVDGRYNRQMALNARIRARLLLKEEADEEDLEAARELVNRSKFVTTRTGVIDPTTGKEELDGNAIHGVESKKAIKRKESDDKQMLDAIVEVMANETLKQDGSKKRDYFEAQDVLWIFAKNNISGWGLYEVQRKLDSWLKAGRLIEKGAPGGGRYALV